MINMCVCWKASVYSYLCYTRATCYGGFHTYFFFNLFANSTKQQLFGKVHLLCTLQTKSSINSVSLKFQFSCSLFCWQCVYFLLDCCTFHSSINHTFDSSAVRIDKHLRVQAEISKKMSAVGLGVFLYWCNCSTSTSHILSKCNIICCAPRGM